MAKTKSNDSEVKETIYIKGVDLKERESDYFELKFSGKTDDFIEQLKEHTNEKGYFNFIIKKKKEKGLYGDTHYIVVNPWKP